MAIRRSCKTTTKHVRVGGRSVPVTIRTTTTTQTSSRGSSVTVSSRIVSNRVIRF